MDEKIRANNPELTDKSGNTSSKAKRRTAKTAVPADTKKTESAESIVPLTESSHELQNVYMNDGKGKEFVKKKAVRVKSIPYFLIIGLICISGIVMFMISLIIETDEYNKQISGIQAEINALKETANRLEVQLEAKYDLDEIERIATEKYGMVSRDTLPKRYITISGNEDVCELVDNGSDDENGLAKLVKGFATTVRDWME